MSGNGLVDAAIGVTALVVAPWAAPSVFASGGALGGLGLGSAAAGSVTGVSTGTALGGFSGFMASAGSTLAAVGGAYSTVQPYLQGASLLMGAAGVYQAYNTPPPVDYSAYYAGVANDNAIIARQNATYNAQLQLNAGLYERQELDADRSEMIAKLMASGVTFASPSAGVLITDADQEITQAWAENQAQIDQINYEGDLAVAQAEQEGQIQVFNEQDNQLSSAIDIQSAQTSTTSNLLTTAIGFA